MAAQQHENVAGCEAKFGRRILRRAAVAHDRDDRNAAPIAQLDLGETFPSRRRAVGHENGVGGRPGKVPPQLVEAFSFEPEAAQRAVLLAADKIHLERNDVPGQVILLKHALSIIVRTRYVAEIERLYRLGANEVIPEEFETSIEIFSRVLQEYHLPRNIIALQVDLIRREQYGALRGLRLEGKRLDELGRYLAGTTADTVLVTDSSPAAGKSLAEIELRDRSGITVIAVVRDGVSTQNPSAEFRLAAGDILVLLGSHQQLDEAARIVSPAPLD